MGTRNAQQQQKSTSRVVGFTWAFMVCPETNCLPSCPHVRVVAVILANLLKSCTRPRVKYYAVSNKKQPSCRLASTALLAWILYWAKGMAQCALRQIIHAVCFVERGLSSLQQKDVCIKL